MRVKSWRFKIAVLATMLMSLSGVGWLSLATANALPSSFISVNMSADALQNDACDGLNQLNNNSQACGKGQSVITKIVAAVINILSTVIGIAAVIMIIVAGFKYITSGGDAGNVSSAKNTLVYALVGIAVAVLAQFLVHFVINKFK